MESFSKIVRLGTLPRVGSVFCKIDYHGGKLSITGVEGPLHNGDARGSCGQIVMSLREPSGLDGFDAAPGWSATMVTRFLKVWDRWHLNDMTAGSPAQEAYLRANPVKSTYPESHYVAACKALTAAGLNPDNGYSYGSAWLREDVPADVLEWLQSLPDTDKKPAWV